MRLEVMTCDACGADITDGWSQWEAEGGSRYTIDPANPHTVIDACSPRCLVRALAGVCDLCGVLLAPGVEAATTHAAWHVERGEGYE